ncbi:MAG: hypothetical protein AB3N16_00315 [Flavobacteriaceae bacterium]
MLRTFDTFLTLSSVYPISFDTNVMKRSVSIFFILYSSIVTCQDLTEPSILSASDDWGKEIIKFPIEWAPKLTLKGFEELRFAPFWSDPKSDQFWSLVMAWKVKASGKLTTKAIEDNFEAYFDGLMIPNHWATTFPKPSVVLVQNPERNVPHSLIGKLKLFDGFHTGQRITLNVQVEQHFCDTTHTSNIIFRLSPKYFEHAIWDELNNIVRKPTSCE